MSESMRGRKVRVTGWSLEEKLGDPPISYIGTFHDWGLEADAREEFGSYTVAIIEKSDGSIETVTPEYVTFLKAKDKGGSKMKTPTVSRELMERIHECVELALEEATQHSRRNESIIQKTLDEIDEILKEVTK